MKKSLLITSLLFHFSFANAQFEKGQKALSGSIVLFNLNVKNDSTLGYSNPTTFTLQFNPSFGIWKTPKKQIGFGILYGITNQSTKTSSLNYNEKEQSVGGNFYIADYNKLSDKLFFVLNWNNLINYAFSNTKDEIIHTAYTDHTLNISTALSPGLSYKLNNRFLLEAMFYNILQMGYYKTTTTTSKPNSKDERASLDYFAFGSSLNNGSYGIGNIGFGFKYLLKNK